MKNEPQQPNPNTQRVKDKKSQQHSRLTVTIGWV